MREIDTPEAAELQELWAAMRAANTFVLGVLNLGAGGRDHVDTILLIAIVQANISPITSQVDLQARYADLHASPPDALRRPISLSALSTSLRMPFESVRRRVRRLATLDLCELTEVGVRVPQRAMEAQAHDSRLAADYDLVKHLYRCLPAVRRLQNIPRAEAGGVAKSDPPIRAVARVSYDYFLSFLESVTTRIGELLMTLSWMAVLHNNVDHLPIAAATGTGAARTG